MIFPILFILGKILGVLAFIAVIVLVSVALAVSDMEKTRKKDELRAIVQSSPSHSEWDQRRSLDSERQNVIRSLTSQGTAKGPRPYL